MNESQITKQLDELHAAAEIAQHTKDLAAFRRLFSERLEFTPWGRNGVGLEELIRRTSSIWKRMKSFSTTLQRESFEVHSATSVSEIVNQVVNMNMRFGVFYTTRLNLQRRIKYTWILEGADWKIINGEVLEQTTL